MIWHGDKRKKHIWHEECFFSRNVLHGECVSLQQEA